MKLQEQCTTIEQSKRLLDMGFNKDTASLNWLRVSKIDARFEDYISTNMVGSDIMPQLPCWTTSDLMDIISRNADIDADLVVADNQSVFLRDMDGLFLDEVEFVVNPLLRDNLFDCLVWLKENKYL